MTARSDAVNELKSTYAVLKGDLDAAVALGEQHDSPFARRTAVRTLFALVEGLTNHLASVTTASAGSTPIEGMISADDLAVLREERRTPLKERIKVVLRCYPVIHLACFQPDFSGQGRQSLHEAIRVRDRLTHPKAKADLGVSESDMEQVARASQWYQSTVVALLKACQDADERLRGREPATRA